MLKQQLCRFLLKGFRLLRVDHFLPDEWFLRLLYFRVFNKSLNLDNPQTFNEKLQWLKLNYRKPLLTALVDKYEVKHYVSEKIGREFVIPTIGIWRTFDDIDFSSLPDQFVLKCTHDSGGVIIVKEKAKFDIREASKKLAACLSKNHYWSGREWPYKNVVPRIIAEPYLEDKTTHELTDYKFFCFDSVVKVVMVATERQTGHTKFDFYDPEFRHLPFRWGHDFSSKLIEKPEGFEEMKEIAKKLSSGFPHVRVDLYNVNSKIFFGELTFFHWSGMCPFEPEEWDNRIGEWIKLP